MDYGQHLVTTLVCFVKAEGGREGGFCPGDFVRGLMSGGLMYLSALETLRVEALYKSIPLPL